MTGAQTDPVHVPRYTTAVSLVLRIAGRVFEAASRHSAFDMTLYGHYSNLRAVAQKMLDTHDTALSSTMQARLVLALKTAHDLAHDHDMTAQREMSVCECETAETARLLLLKFVLPEVPCEA